MTALGALVREDQADALNQLRVQLFTAPPPTAPTTAAVCPACGQPKPAPAAVFQEPRCA